MTKYGTFDTRRMGRRFLTTVLRVSPSRYHWLSIMEDISSWGSEYDMFLTLAISARCVRICIDLTWEVRMRKEQDVQKRQL